jgi:small-conductance mechanosensitive channel
MLAGVIGAALAQDVPKTVREQLEAIRLELAQTEAALQRDTLNDRRLGELRAALDPLSEKVEEIIQREQPRADEIKARIDRLGPAPDATKGQTESAEVARDRAEQQKLWQEGDETLRLSRALALRIDQNRDAIAERRRANFARQILAQGPSILSPLLWFDVTQALPGDIKALRFVFTQWAEVIAGNLDWYEIAILVGLAIGAAIGVPRAHRWMAGGGFLAPRKDGVRDDPAIAAPTGFAKAVYALRRILLLAVAPVTLVIVLEWLLTNFGLVPPRLNPVLNAVMGGVALVFGMSGLANAMLAPGRPAWRLFALPDRMAEAFGRLIATAVLVIAIGKVLEALQGAIVAPLPATIAAKGVMAVLVALVVARGLHRAFATEDGDDHSVEGEAATLSAHPPPGLAPLRLAAWAGVTTIIGAALVGFVALASFLVDQLLWLAGLGLLMLLALVLIDEVLGAGLAARGMLGRRVREATGLKASSLDQLSVLGSGLARLMLYIVIGMLVLAPWGIDSSNLFGNLRAAFFGFQVGGVTISLSTIVIAIILFAFGFGATRAIQNWLDTRYLPKTGLDIGLRNSIRTIFGYVGTILAATFALTQLGLSFEKLAIVAGALSVGIGFGLRSIVENFVSGLILLWERPIRVGDQIVIGEEQGTVRRINVRATEIETFDKASLIIPNSEFISGRVKNWMHADRTGRIIIPVSVEYNADPETVDALLREAALAHREVLSEPKPFVLFKNLGESGLDFELYCYVDVDSRATTRSELLFDIFRRLKEAGIHIPYPTRRLEIANIGEIDPRTLAALDQDKARQG